MIVRWLDAQPWHGPCGRPTGGGLLRKADAGTCILTDFSLLPASAVALQCLVRAPPSTHKRIGGREKSRRCLLDVAGGDRAAGTAQEEAEKFCRDGDLLNASRECTPVHAREACLTLSARGRTGNADSTRWGAPMAGGRGRAAGRERAWAHPSIFLSCNTVSSTPPFAWRAGAAAVAVKAGRYPVAAAAAGGRPVS